MLKIKQKFLLNKKNKPNIDKDNNEVSSTIKDIKTAMEDKNSFVTTEKDKEVAVANQSDISSVLKVKTNIKKDSKKSNSIEKCNAVNGNKKSMVVTEDNLVETNEGKNSPALKTKPNILKDVKKINPAVKDQTVESNTENNCNNVETDLHKENEKCKNSKKITKVNDKCQINNMIENCNIKVSESVEAESEEETSSDESSDGEDSYEESSDEEPSGRVSFTDDSSDEVGMSHRAKGSRNDSGFNSPSSSLLDTPACSPEGSTESRERGSPTRRYSNAALSLDSLSDSQDGSRHHRHDHRHGVGRVTPPATTIPRYRKYAIDDFQFLKVLGKGSFGKVLLAELKGTQYYYAVKCLKKDVVLEDDDVECTLIERKVLALGTKHPFLCHLFCTFQTESHLFFVMEYLNGGDLMFHIQNEGRFDEGRARFYAAEIVSGLKFLHSKGIVYRDLKLDNILLDFDGHVRIADFGMCKLQIYLDRMADTFCGTPDYMAPEIIKGLKYNQGADWWSFGVLLYEMLVGQSPFSGCDEDDLFWCICNKNPQYPRYITLEGKTILRQLLEKDSSKRLGANDSGALDVIMHPFFNGLDWTRLERRELLPPFKPDVSHPLDVQYFDRAFTAERARLTPVDKSILQSMDQTQFQGFTYTNPNCTE
uniref:protein kinase C n=1 Tax=Clastoptera arizonana TaxID=38151 RepID=A0A1B6D3M7_9HEMI